MHLLLKIYQKLLVLIRNQTTRRNHMMLTDSTPIFHVETNIASATPKKEENEADYFLCGEADDKIRKQQPSPIESTLGDAKLK